MDFNRWVSAYKQIADLENRPDVSDYIQKTYWNAEKGVYDLPDEREENKKDMKITKLSQSDANFVLNKLESLEEELKSIKRELAESTSDENISLKDLKDYIETNNILYGYDWDEEEQKFTDGETEYQLRTFTNSDEMESILVRFCDDKTHTYAEFFLNDYAWEDIDKLLAHITSDEFIQTLSNKIEAKLLKSKQSKSLDEHLVNKDELVRGRHIKFADKHDGYTLKDAYILWTDDFDVNKYDVVYTEEELRNLDGRKAVTIQYKDIAQVLDLIEMPDPDDELLDGEPEMDYHVTGDALDRMKANRFSDPEYFDKDEDGEFFVTGYVANYEYSPAEGGDYYIEGWYPVCSKAFATIEQARKYLYDCKKEYQKDGFKVYDYTQDSFRCEEDSKYIAHEEYKYFVEPKAKRYSRTEKGHGWDW